MKEKQEQIMQKAKELFAQRKYNDAIVKCNKLIRLDVNNYEVQLLRACCNSELGSNIIAIKRYDEAMKLLGNDDLRRAKLYYCKGNSEFAMKHFNGADKYYSEAIIFHERAALDPDNIELCLTTEELLQLYLSKGECQIEKTNYKYAIDCYNKVIELDPNNAKATYQKKICEQKIERTQKGIQVDNAQTEYESGIFFQNLNDYQHANKCFSKAIKLGLKNVDVYFNKATCLEYLGNYEDAIGFYKELIRLDPNNTKAHHQKAQCLEHLGNYEDAIGSYKELIRLDPNNAKAHHQIVKCFEALHKPQDALEFYIHAIKLEFNDYYNVIGYCEQKIKTDNKNAKAYYLMGRCLEKLEKPQDALKFYDKAIELEFKNFDLYYHRGLCLENIGCIHDALKSYRSAISYCKNKQLDFHNDYPEIIKCCNNILKIEPNNIVVLSRKMLCLRKLEQYPEVLECCNNILKIEPNNIKGHYFMAVCFKKQKQYQEAIKCYDKIIKIETNNDIIYYEKGICLQNLGSHAAALECYNKAIELGFKNFEELGFKKSDLYHRKGKCYENLKLWQEALDSYNKAIEIDPLADNIQNLKLCQFTCLVKQGALKVFGKEVNLELIVNINKPLEQDQIECAGEGLQIE